MINEIQSILDKSKKIALEDPAKSYDLSKMAFKFAEEKGMRFEMGRAYFNMAYACRVMSDYTDGLKYAYNALNIFEEFEDQNSVLQVRNIIGIIYFYYGDYKTALENFNKALDLLTYVENVQLESSVLNNIGEIYRMAGNYQRAVEYYLRSLTISEEHQLIMNIPVINANIGEIYYLQKNYEKANEYFNQSYKASLNSNDTISKGEALTKLGKIETVQGHYEQAKAYFISALEMFNRVQNKFYLVETLIAFSELDPKIYRNPKLHLLEALNHAIENKLALKISIIYKLLVDYYELGGDFEHALQYHKLYFQNEKEIEAINIARKLELLALEFEFYKEKSEYEQNKLLSEKLTREIEESKIELEEIKAQNETLIEVSTIDELTRTYNRRGINMLLKDNILQRDDGLDLVLMIDIDRFKQYNDFWGHMKGDLCLQIIAKTLKTLTFNNYFVGRYGGEEFICYMKVSSIDEAREIAEEIRERIYNLNIAYTSDPNSEYVSVSIGGVVDQMEIAQINNYINFADKWLYQSKINGRNRVSIGAVSV